MRTDFYKLAILITMLIMVNFTLSSQTVTTITTSTSWTVPVGVTSLKIEAWGGGGGGGASLYGSGGGGGGGAFSTTTWSVTPGETYTITIGSGGNGGTVLAVQGQSGFSTSISGNAGTLSAAGGNGGSGGIGSISGITITNVNGSGGSGGSGDFNGGNGATASNASGSGGGGAGNAGAGGAGTTAAAGAGGAGSPSLAPYPGGNGGLRVSSNNAGAGGSIPGGGGGGARSWSSVSPRNGGNGARGQIVLTYTPNVCTNSSLTLTSGLSTNQQSLCNGISLTDITYAIAGDATGASVAGLPLGVSGVFNAGVFTISGTPTESGVFNYSVITSGTPSPCLEDTATGIITVYDALGQNGEESATLDSSAIWTVPDGVSAISVEAWGGGGAGGGAELTFLGIGGGGGGGAYALKKDISVTPYQSLTVVVAQPSTGLAAGNGPDGGFSTISGWENEIYAAGGKGGRRSVFLSPYPNGGEGGKASDSKGDCTADGFAGLKGFRVTAAIPPPVPTPVDGAGGQGATANGGQGGTPIGEFIGDGNPGNAPGGGGSGSRSSATLTLNTTGGTGAAGRIVIWYQCPEITNAGEIGSDQTICYQTVPTVITGVLDATATEGLIDYQWQLSIVSGTDGFADITSATGTSFSPDTLSQTTWFRRMAKPKCSSDWPVNGISNVVEIEVLPQFVAGEILTNGEELCSGADASQIGNATPATGGDEAIAYQWQFSVSGDFTDAIDIADATEAFYNPGVLTSSVSYRRLAKDGTCAVYEPSAGLWSVVVHPASAGGSVTGGGMVCYGVNSTILTLAGNTGDPQIWQWSLNGSGWMDITGATGTTYTAENLTENKWFRVKVKSGTCPSDSSAADSVIINTDFKISGFAKYENNPQTPLNGLKISLIRDGSTLNSQITGSNGYYEFTGLVSGNYSLEIQSSHASGQWQTWGGVNNTDYLLVSKHIAGTQLLPVNPPVVRTSASVKLSHPLINNTDATAIRQAAKFPQTGYSYFDTTKWVFSGIDAAQALNNITVGCADVTRDILGLCSGDVNGTYVPQAGYKAAEPGLELVNRGTLPVTDEIIFPIRVDRDMEIGAITLYLDYDPSKMVVTDVKIGTTVANVTNSPKLWYNILEPTLNLKPETLNTLQIGWMSMEPIHVDQEETLLLIHTRLTETYRTSHFTFSDSRYESEELNVKPKMRNVKCEIGFALNDNLLSELADADGNVISGLKLSIPDAGTNSETAKWRDSEILVYPNPAKEVVYLQVVAETDKMLEVEFFNLPGKSVLKPETVSVVPGLNTKSFDVGMLPCGAYLMKITMGDLMEIRKIIVNR